MASPVVNLTGAPFQDTKQVGGSRFGWPNPAVLNPQGFGPTQINAPVTSITGPPFFGPAGIVNSGSQGAAAASASPLSLQKSPLLWAVIGLIGAVVAYHQLAYKSSKK